MNYSFRKTLLAAVLLSASMAQAAPITANVTIDLDTALTGSTWTAIHSPLDSILHVNTGDTVTVNISFVGDQQLNWLGDGYFNPWLLIKGWEDGTFESSQFGGFSLTNELVTFQNLSIGSQFAPVGDTESCCIHLGPTFQIFGDNIVRQFSGVSTTFTADLQGAPFREYGTIGYEGTPIFEGTLSKIAGAEVPEPESIALFGIGLLGVALARRKRA